MLNLNLDTIKLLSSITISVGVMIMYYAILFA